MAQLPLHLYENNQKNRTMETLYPPFRLETERVPTSQPRVQQIELLLEWQEQSIEETEPFPLPTHIHHHEKQFQRMV